MDSFPANHAVWTYSVRLECGDYIVPTLSINEKVHLRKPLGANLVAHVTQAASSSKPFNVFWVENDRKEIWLQVGQRALVPGEVLHVTAATVDTDANSEPDFDYDRTEHDSDDDC